jgi:hypothetical protein
VGKWAKSPQTRSQSHFFVPTFVFKSGQKPIKSGQKLRKQAFFVRTLPLKFCKNPQKVGFCPLSFLKVGREFTQNGPQFTPFLEIKSRPLCPSKCLTIVPQIPNQYPDQPQPAGQNHQNKVPQNAAGTPPLLITPHFLFLLS